MKLCFVGLSLPKSRQHLERDDQILRLWPGKKFQLFKLRIGQSGIEFLHIFFRKLIALNVDLF